MELTDYSKNYEDALLKEDFEKISEIISILNNSPFEFKEKALPLYEKINDDLFQKSRSLSNYDLDKFRLSIKKGKDESKPSNITVKVTIKGKEEFSFDQHFLNFYNLQSSIFHKLKDYYFLRLENPEVSEKPVTIVLCDDDGFHNPRIDALQADSIQKPEKHTISDFVKANSVAEGVKSNYTSVLHITPQLGDNKDLKKQLSDLFGLFTTVSLINVTSTNPLIEVKDFAIKSDKEEIINQICLDSNKIFNNEKLSFEEQKIIKKFFGDQAVILNYKVLKPGASGSSVIEVQGASRLLPNTKRFVIKISKKEVPSKLLKEEKNFDAFVKNAITESSAYNAKYISTETLEAIQYNYASGNSVITSYSFNELIEDFLWSNKTDKVNFDEINKVITALLQCDLIKSWNKTQDKLNITCGELYQKYLKHEKKVFEAIDEICNDEATTTELKENYEKIKNLKIDTKEKICHGDLHSENFFWDGNRVYLIDFGFTDEHHALVDHAFLEISLRLKHFPRYIGISELEGYEEKFTELNSFENTFDLSFIKRPKIKDLYQIIHQIRTDSKQYFKNKNSPKEYLIALFFLSFRLTQYTDLNQLYAMRMAELLGKKILKL